MKQNAKATETRANTDAQTRGRGDTEKAILRFAGSAIPRFPVSPFPRVPVSPRFRFSRAPLLMLGLALLSSAGCQSFGDFDWPWDRVELPPPPKESAVYRAGHWDRETAPQPGTLEGDFASARVLYDRQEYAKAEKVFRKLRARAEKEKNSDMIEECLFMEAQSQFAQKEYPHARETYAKLLQNYPTSRYRSEAVDRQYAIADFWLDDTRDEIEAARDGRNRWFSNPFNFDKEKPLVGEEDHAIGVMQAVYTQDPTGPLAPTALFKAGSTKFYREDYAEADRFFSTLVDQHPKSKLAPEALEMAIQAKTQTTGGPDYDGRKLAEARQLVDTALRSYPELRNKDEFLQRTLYSINEQQAQKDFNIAEFYRRTKHPGAAYFYYEIVRRRYAGSTWAEKATARMNEIRDNVEKKSAK